MENKSVRELLIEGYNQSYKKQKEELNNEQPTPIELTEADKMKRPIHYLIEGYRQKNK